MLKRGDIYSLEKNVWTDADFGQMGWHDVVVHALGFDGAGSELLLDLDYLFAWVEPEPPSTCFSFWIAPATLVFHQVWDMKMSYDASLGFQLLEIQRGEERACPHAPPDAPRREWHWTLEGVEGAISFWAGGYTQHTRHRPRHHDSQSLKLVERGGFGFDRPEAPAR
ncbi:MAG: hypothetical protein ACO1TE_20875 [Prosthecobacter sp.]